MKKLIHFLLIITAATLLNSAFAAQPTISRIVVFGDSLSDTGKMYQKSLKWIPSSPPYYDGRFSDGPVWVDYLKSQLMQDNIPISIINEAEGGATAATYDITDSPVTLFINTLSNELSQFLSKDYFRTGDLVIVWAGGNDYLNQKQESVDTVLSAIDNLLNHAINSNASQVIAFNLPRLDTTPHAHKKLPGKLSELAKITREHNNRLLQLIKKYDNEKVKVFDIESLLDHMMSNPEQYALTNTTQACYTKGYVWRPFIKGKNTMPYIDDYHSDYLSLKPMDQMSAEELALLFQNPAFTNNPMLQDALPQIQTKKSGPQRIEPAGDAPESCDGYLFWDKIHPTTATHKELASKFYTYLFERSML
ncbi:SGNH/GDSL hydrolase family protein [Zooshikella marina]|uniref:SGNH/GDSL hydrolase family protein n=1 Tax=Zooshikella ganghwensis TaxID=202772 RepID=UPI001BAF14B0|nr:SGNH/GDSL hydrolase family protein [Zooshikella ganghwensis]MBU2705895.1 SGNH/GDSL hydrolase family protein [Zooshikella ganghwensis]